MADGTVSTGNAPPQASGPAPTVAQTSPLTPQALYVRAAQGDPVAQKAVSFLRSSEQPQNQTRPAQTPMDLAIQGQLGDPAAQAAYRQYQSLNTDPLAKLADGTPARKRRYR